MKSVNTIWSVLFCLLLGVGTAGAQEAADQAGDEAAPAGTDAQPAAEPAAEAVQAQEAPAQPAMATGEVARSTFATGVQNHEPVDQIDTATADIDTIYFFTELKGLEGQTVQHRWEYDGEVLAEVSFDVGGSRWRVWSTKKMLPTWTGQWTVSVVNGSGEVIDTKQFQYQPAPEAEPVESEPADAAEQPAASEAGAEADAGAEQADEPAVAE